MDNSNSLDRAYRYGKEWLLLTDSFTIYKVEFGADGTPKFTKALIFNIDTDSKEYSLEYLMEVPNDILDCTLKLLKCKGVISADYSRI